jgi:hypothetical protein
MQRWGKKRVTNTKVEERINFMRGIDEQVRIKK